MAGDLAAISRLALAATGVGSTDELNAQLMELERREREHREQVEELQGAGNCGRRFLIECRYWGARFLDTPRTYAVLILIGIITALFGCVLSIGGKGSAPCAVPTILLLVVVNVIVVLSTSSPSSPRSSPLRLALRPTTHHHLAEL